MHSVYLHCHPDLNRLIALSNEYAGLRKKIIDIEFLAPYEGLKNTIQRTHKIDRKSYDFFEFFDNIIYIFFLKSLIE